MKVGPSPAWLRDRLELVGVRSINNVVDLTNYVMIEMGQPSHAFDLARVPGGKLVVRWSREGEKVTTLDGNERALPSRVGVIAGRGGAPALALAGIMGGASSEIGEATRVVALEAAWWEPLAVRRGARALGMHTEASHRFERGADIAAGPAAIDRLAHLLAKIGAGTVRPGLVERKGHDRPARTVRHARGAGERPPRRRGAAAAAGAHPRVARLPGHRLRSRGDRPRAARGASTSRARRTSPRRWAATSGSSGSRPRFRPRPGRAVSGPRSGASGASARS